jgi:hypothetical protein
MTNAAALRHSGSVAVRGALPTAAAGGSYAAPRAGIKPVAALFLFVSEHEYRTRSILR